MKILMTSNLQTVSQAIAASLRRLSSQKMKTLKFLNPIWTTLTEKNLSKRHNKKVHFTGRSLSLPAPSRHSSLATQHCQPSQQPGISGLNHQLSRRRLQKRKQIYQRLTWVCHPQNLQIRILQIFRGPQVHSCLLLLHSYKAPTF
jgi:hypothetical protein